MRIAPASVFIVLLLTAFLATAAQTPDPTLATSKAGTVSAADLPDQAREVLLGWPQQTAQLRNSLFDQLIAEELLRLESRATGKTAAEILARERAKVIDPPLSQIEAVYEANRRNFADRTLAQMRDQIVAFLRREPEQKAIDAALSQLRIKFKYSSGKDVNAVGLGPLDVLATVGGRSITSKEFEDRFRFEMNDAEHHHYEHIRDALVETVFNRLLGSEASARGTSASSILATEITDKIRDFTESEREELVDALRDSLFAKYEVNLLLKEPARIARKIDTSDEPAVGPVDAPVTIVMFSDFQCSACARSHPVLKRVIAEFPGKVRLVVRDLPLESIHPDAFNAALAANAASKQGKHAQYVELLYKNQNSLDRASLLRFAAETGLNTKQFEIDFTDAANAKEVRSDMNDAELAGATGTPTIFVNGVKVHALSADAFRRAIRSALQN